MLRLKFLIPIFLICQFLTSQTKFEKGFFKNSSGDSIACYIKNIRWLYSPNKISYKSNLNEEERELDVSNVQEFQIYGGPRYVSVKDSFPLTERLTKNKSIDKNPKLILRNTFVKEVSKGKASLFEYRGDNDLIYLVSLDGEKPFPLLYKQYVKVGSNDIKENNIFKRQLLKLVNCDGTAQIQKVTYDKSSIKEYLNDFNLCHGSISSELSTKRPMPNQGGELRIKVIGGVVGYDFSTVLEAFEGTGLSARRVTFQTNFEEKISPSLGLELESILPFNNKKWSVFLSSQFASYSSSTSAVLNGNEVRAANIELAQLIFNLGGRHYLFLDDKNSIIISSGLVFDYNIKADFEEEEAFFTALTDLNKVNFGLFIGGGYSFNQNLYLSANYYVGTSINEDAAQENNLKRFAITLGLKL